MCCRRMVSQSAMPSHRAVESKCGCWNPGFWLLVLQLESLVVVAFSSVLQVGECVPDTGVVK